MLKPTLQRTSMSNDKVYKDLRTSQIESSKQDIKRVIAAISGFTNPFCSDVKTSELYCLSSGVPAKLDVANDLLKASDIGRNAMKHFVKTRLVDKTIGFHEHIKRNKLKTFAASQVTKKVTSSKNKVSQIRADRNVFGQLVLLAIQHDVDLELALSFPLGPVPWSFANADGMPTKTDKHTLLHNLESGIELVTDRPSDAVHVVDRNAMLQS